MTSADWQIHTNVLEKVAASIFRVAYVEQNTGHFIMHSGITKIYNRKTGGHIFMKPVQIEGTTQKFFSQ
jgi:hypothetical protein